MKESGGLISKFLNPENRSRNKFGMTKSPDPHRHVMLNLFQHLVRIFSALSSHIFYLRPQDPAFMCNLNKAVRLNV